MTSRVFYFAVLQARNLGYAKGEIANALRNDGCEVYIHLNPGFAKYKQGIKYRDNTSVK